MTNCVARVKSCYVRNTHKFKKTVPVDKDNQGCDNILANGKL